MIYIFYRQCYNNNFNQFRPSWFSYEKCFANLVQTLDKRCFLNVVFDGDKDQYDKHFTKKYKIDNVDFINAGNDMASNVKTFHIIKNLKLEKSDLIYILENDYLHLSNWVDCVEDLYKSSNGGHYTTLFDHNDKYLFQNNVEGEWGMYKNLVSKIFATKTHHWRTVPNTCGSFIMSRQLFDDDFDVLSLPEADNTRFDILGRTKHRFVLSPIPGLSTHVQNPWMSPCISWGMV